MPLHPMPLRGWRRARDLLEADRLRLGRLARAEDGRLRRLLLAPCGLVPVLLALLLLLALVRLVDTYRRRRRRRRRRCRHDPAPAPARQLPARGTRHARRAVRRGARQPTRRPWRPLARPPPRALARAEQ